jgi:flagellar motility protein MotE (MotC chaperone)
MFHRKIIFLALLINQLYAINVQQGDLYKEKQELIAIKDELNEFYEKKELEYQKNKVQLENIQKSIKAAEANIQKTKDENQKVLDEINRVITSKAMSMYDKMKLSVVIDIFNEMINNGKIDEVFDIMIRMSDKRVMKILKKLDTQTSTLIMKKMRILKEETNKEEN